MAKALGFTKFTRTLVNTFTNGFSVALVISRFSFSVIASRARVDGVTTFACFESANAYFVALT
jgi:enoyl-[acyl-carrier-protein] reductase (NADH)